MFIIITFSIHIFWLFEIINFTSKTQPKKAVCDIDLLISTAQIQTFICKIYFINGNHEIPNVQIIQIIYEVAYNFFYTSTVSRDNGLLNCVSIILFFKCALT